MAIYMRWIIYVHYVRLYKNNIIDGGENWQYEFLIKCGHGTGRAVYVLSLQILFQANFKPVYNKQINNK